MNVQYEPKISRSYVGKLTNSRAIAGVCRLACDEFPEGKKPAPCG